SPLRRKASAVSIQETKIALPPTKGAKLKSAVMVVPVATDELAATLALKRLTPGSGDHGPVHSTTTTMRMAKGSHAWTISPVVRPCPLRSSVACSLAETGTPP